MRSFEAVREALKSLQASLQHAEDDTKGSGPVNNLLKELEKIYDATSPVHGAVVQLREACGLYSEEKMERIQLALRSTEYLVSRLAQDLEEISGWVAAKPADHVEDPEVVRWFKTRAPAGTGSGLTIVGMNIVDATAIATPEPSLLEPETGTGEGERDRAHEPKRPDPKTGGIRLRTVQAGQAGSRKVDIANAFRKLNSTDFLEITPKDDKGLLAGILKKKPTKAA